nr:MAG TPA: hypothetical protein [Bacteriophage sp.]
MNKVPSLFLVPSAISCLATAKYLYLYFIYSGSLLELLSPSLATKLYLASLDQSYLRLPFSSNECASQQPSALILAPNIVNLL